MKETFDLVNQIVRRIEKYYGLTGYPNPKFSKKEKNMLFDEVYNFLKGKSAQIADAREDEAN